MPICRSSGACEMWENEFYNILRLWRSGPITLISMTFYLHTLHFTFVI
jgi:hypothetical protein